MRRIGAPIRPHPAFPKGCIYCSERIDVARVAEVNGAAALFQKICRFAPDRTERRSSPERRPGRPRFSRSADARQNA